LRQWGLVPQLEQLLAQAAGLDVFLRGKVREWAVSADGCLMLRDAGFEQRWARIREQGLEAHVRRAPLKAASRVLEKVHRAYGLDPSRVLDCCRQAIYFEDAGSLHRCVEAIGADGAARIIRLTDRLRGSYDAAATAGYRDVMMNLTISTEETRRLGLDAVVCELQLALVAFARIKVQVVGREEGGVGEHWERGSAHGASQERRSLRVGGEQEGGLEVFSGPRARLFRLCMIIRVSPFQLNSMPYSSPALALDVSPLGPD
jgi:hypothetical protein